MSSVKYFYLIALTLGLILLGSTVFGSAPFVFADGDDDDCPPKHKYGDICDRKRPKIEIIFPSWGEKIEGPTSVVSTGTASDDESGIKEVTVRVDFGPRMPATFDPNTGTWTFPTATLDIGPHFLVARAEDKANNFKRDFVFFKIVSSEDEINIRVDSKRDDAEQKGSRVKTTSRDLDLNEEDYVGLRFDDVNIPDGSTITKAFVRFTVEDRNGDSGTAIVNIFGQDSDNAPRFSKSNNNISNRPLTDETVEWNIPKWNKRGDSGIAQTTPDISNIIQEIVDRTLWTEGNSIVIIIEKDQGNDRDAYAFDKRPSRAALLHVEFS